MSLISLPDPRALSPIPFRTSLDSALATPVSTTTLVHVNSLLHNRGDIPDLATLSEFELWLFLSSSAHGYNDVISIASEFHLKLLEHLLTSAHARQEIWNPLLDFVARFNLGAMYKQYGHTVRWPIWSKGGINQSRRYSEADPIPSPEAWLDAVAPFLQSLPSEKAIEIFSEYTAPQLRRAIVRNCALPPEFLKQSVLKKDDYVEPLVEWATSSSNPKAAWATVAQTAIEGLAEVEPLPDVTDYAHYRLLRIALDHVPTFPVAIPSNLPSLSLALSSTPLPDPKEIVDMPEDKRFILAGRSDLTPAHLDALEEAIAKTSHYHSSKQSPALRAYLNVPYLAEPMMLRLASHALNAHSQDPLLSLLNRREATLAFYKFVLEHAPSSWDQIRPALARFPLVRSSIELRTILERSRTKDILVELVKDPNPTTFNRLFPKLLKLFPNTALELLEESEIAPTVQVTRATLAPLLARGTDQQRRRAFALLSRLAPTPAPLARSTP